MRRFILSTRVFNEQTSEWERMFFHPPLNENRLTRVPGNASQYKNIHDDRRAARLIPQDVEIEVVEVVC